jgi:hypothetical protein
MSVPSVGIGATVGARGSLPSHRALHVPRARQKYAKRIRRSHAYVAGVGRGGDCSRWGAGVGRFDDVMGLGQGGRRPYASSDLAADTLLTPLVEYAYY